jgi:DHA3 family macrolide efflux protein-like MFS transporter
MSAGALAGGVAIALIGNVEQRIPVVLAGYLLHGCLLIAYGVARHPIWLGISVFLAMFPLPFNGALFSTLVQSKSPPDMEGRIFGSREGAGTRSFGHAMSRIRTSISSRPRSSLTSLPVSVSP